VSVISLSLDIQLLICPRHARVGDAKAADMRGEDVNTIRAETGVATRRPKTGGRKRGTPNKRTVERQQLLATIRASGRDPISFFSDLLQNETAPLELRFQAAKELAPYMHPKLTSIEARPGGMGHEERLEMLNAMLEDAKRDE
jgi:hypothetical protein